MIQNYENILVRKIGTFLEFFIFRQQFWVFVHYFAFLGEVDTSKKPNARPQKKIQKNAFLTVISYFFVKKNAFFLDHQKNTKLRSKIPFFRILLGFFEVPEFVRTIFNAKLAW